MLTVGNDVTGTCRSRSAQIHFGSQFIISWIVIGMYQSNSDTGTDTVLCTASRTYCRQLIPVPFCAKRAPVSLTSPNKTVFYLLFHTLSTLNRTTPPPLCRHCPPTHTPHRPILLSTNHPCYNPAIPHPTIPPPPQPPSPPL